MNQISLNGVWKLRWSDGQRGRPQYAELPDDDDARYIDAIVPGEVHLDLLRAKLISDPYIFAQAKESRWVEDCIWSYRRFFDVTEEICKGSSWLCFETLDLNAKIALNGETIATHQNFFYPCRVEVTGKLKKGRNLLTVHVEGGLIASSEKPSSGFILQGFDQKIHKRHWQRKPQSQFSWDWAPRLINVGISGDVTLEWTKQSFRLDQFVALVNLNSTLDQGTVRGRFFIEKKGAEPLKVEIALFLEEENIRVKSSVTLREGLHCYEIQIEAPNPELWWPIQHGPQNLYTLHAEILLHHKPLETTTRQIGFRRVTLNQDPHPVSGRYYFFEINNRPLFLKGANIVPSEIIYSKINRSRYEGLIQNAIDANFNFLRVWGGGIYESEDFYNLCDKKGILVWQEFIYACSKYPHYDEVFFQDAKKEALHQIRRLAHRTSLIAWCGNNEIDMSDAWASSQQGVIHPEHPFFHWTLPRILKEEDPSRFYQPSSPYSPDHLPPNQDDVGDQHAWSVGFLDNDFYDYRKMICRFPNEAGFLGPTTLPTMMQCLPPGQQQIQSHAWQFHDNSIDSWDSKSPVDRITEEWLGRPIREMSLEEYAYYGGLIQGEALREFIESFRYKMFSSSCACFWMFNDAWPTPRSFTIIDYYLRKTPSFYSVKRSFQSIHVVIAEENGEIRIFGINETQVPIPCNLQYGLFELKGTYPFNQTKRVTLTANSSTLLASFSSKKLKGNMGAFAYLESGNQIIARNRFFRKKFRKFQWPKAKIQIKVSQGIARFFSETFVWAICLDLTGEAALEDNFFDLYPGIEYSIPWSTLKPPKILYTGNSAPID